MWQQCKSRKLVWLFWGYTDWVTKTKWDALAKKQTFSEAVASRVPCKLRAMQPRTVSCAPISTGDLSVLARSMIWTWPSRRAGNANNELSLSGHRTHKPATQPDDYDRTFQLTNTCDRWQAGHNSSTNIPTLWKKWVRDAAQITDKLQVLSNCRAHCVLVAII